MTDTPCSGGHPALTDEQTGLPNRLHFDTVFKVVFSTGSRGVPSTVLLLEIEGFTEWSGGMERAEVSQVLRFLAGLLRPVLRGTDVLARFDEARFVFCLLDCNLAGGALVADRIDGLLDSIREATGLRFSMGGAVFDREMNEPEDLLGAAEASLRIAHGRGGDQVEFSR